MKLWVAINDERSHADFLNGLELHAFPTEAEAEAFSQLGDANGDDWIVGVLGVPGADALTVNLTLTQAQIDEIKHTILSQEPGKLELAPTESTAWVVGNGAHNRFRAVGGGQVFWVTDTNLATQFARRIDAENFAEEDEDAWQIIQVAALQEEHRPPHTNWELSNRLQEVELMDILRLLAGQDITPSKALEAIHSRVAGNEPALPELGSGMDAGPDPSNWASRIVDVEVDLAPLEKDLTARLVKAFEVRGAKAVLIQKGITLAELVAVVERVEKELEGAKVIDDPSHKEPQQVAAMQPWATNVVVECLAVVIREVMEKYVAYCRGDVGQLRAFFSAIESRNSGFCCDHIVLEDGSTSDDSVEYCIRRAKEQRHLDCLTTMLFIQAIKDEDTRGRVVSPDITAEDVEDFDGC